MDLCGFRGNLQHHRSEAHLGSGLREEFSNPGFLQCRKLDHELQHDHGAWRCPGFDRVIRSDITGVKLTWEAAYAKSFQIQVSSNAVNWTTNYSTTTGPGGVQDLTGLSDRTSQE